jgi:hypothetical protein
MSAPIRDNDAAEPRDALERELADLAQRLRSLHDGELAVFDALALGSEAVPVLRELLFERDRAGIFEPRRRVVRALAALHAFGVLKEFIAGWRPAEDPVERLGDEAVVSAAAGELAVTGDEEAFAVLLGIAREHPIPGVVEAIGSYRRTEAIPVLIAALSDDCAGGPAQRALEELGQDAVAALVDAALVPLAGANGRETPSSIRRRRRALSALVKTGARRAVQARLRPLVDDPDAEIAALACRILLTSADEVWTCECVERLVELLRRATWPLRREVEDSLIANGRVARAYVERALRSAREETSNDLERARFMGSLRRVLMTVRDGPDGSY